MKDFYLNTTLLDPEYLSIPYSLIPPVIIADYKLDTKVSNNTVYAKVNKGMYGSPQAGKLANDDLVAHLAKGGYISAKFIPDLFIPRESIGYGCIA